MKSIGYFNIFLACSILAYGYYYGFLILVTDFQKLQEAKEVLCNEAKRKNYDLWKRSGIAISFHDWQALNDSVKTVCNVFISVSVFIQRFQT